MVSSQDKRHKKLSHLVGGIVYAFKQLGQIGGRKAGGIERKKWRGRGRGDNFPPVFLFRPPFFLSSLGNSFREQRKEIFINANAAQAAGLG